MFNIFSSKGEEALVKVTLPHVSTRNATKGQAEYQANNA